MGVTATGIGSLPLEEIDEALKLVFGELPELPHLPELPARGAGADMIGRTAGAVLVDLHVDLQPAGWRLIDGHSHDEARARELLTRDLDALQIHGHGYGGRFKAQVVGPWTLAASLELQRGDKVLGDTGAVRDLTDSLAEGIGEHLAALRRQLPDAELVLQLDEPSLPAVLAGQVPTASGYRAFAPVEEQLARERLAPIIEAARGAGATTVMHCCAARPPYSLLAVADHISIDAGFIAAADEVRIGELIEAGKGLWLGLVPSLGPGVPPTVRQTIEPARRLWSRLGFPAAELRNAVGVTPACGLAGASMGWVRTAMTLCRRAAQALDEAAEEER